MSELIDALVNGGRPVEEAEWDFFWERLRSGRSAPGETAAVLAGLSARWPGADTLSALLASLKPERHLESVEPFPDTVNIVGTGGGPRTFNVSVAAAFVAAAAGVRVLKTGSRAYTSKVGSVDLLGFLGVPLTGSYAQTREFLDRHGVAFAGDFVYPRELALLARSVYPLDMRTVGRFVSRVGPLLAMVPTTAQITGVSDPSLSDLLLQAGRRSGREIWLCSNDLGVDELLSFCPNTVRTTGGDAYGLSGAELGLAPGGLHDLCPVEGRETVARDFVRLLGGGRSRAATQTVCLNAAAMARAGGHPGSWADLVNSAADAVHSGAAVRLLQDLRDGARTRSGSVPVLGAVS
ncbi:anthranilate phosphoribosyltransferase [Nocardiopsis arvandica]|uniref:Anthranilate phosphoribosyltransferase n=1 Tax=Nocardiopsis sinuspersici TaxID=501010 RepID=A0A7Y9XH12_9ACTN|nr:hypothetical protein [Nocardiopsis sinuspersici]NYH55676.1 anthranilate phosphoribosyltransferase [Nocardiopsis sinuspersici]